MDVIHIILYIIAVVAIIGVVLFLGAILFSIWPIVIGVICLIASITLWKSGHDNIAIICILLTIGGTFFLQVWWMADGMDRLFGGKKGPYFDPMAGKRKRYNADGEIIGYEDRDDD